MILGVLDDFFELPSGKKAAGVGCVVLLGSRIPLFEESKTHARAERVHDAIEQLLAATTPSRDRSWRRAA